MWSKNLSQAFKCCNTIANARVLIKYQHCSEYFICINLLHLHSYPVRWVLLPYLFNRCGNGSTGWCSILPKSIEQPGSLAPHHSCLSLQWFTVWRLCTEEAVLHKHLKRNKVTFLFAFAITYLLFSQLSVFSQRR